MRRYSTGRKRSICGVLYIEMTYSFEQMIGRYFFNFLVTKRSSHKCYKREQMRSFLDECEVTPDHRVFHAYDFETDVCVMAKIER